MLHGSLRNSLQICQETWELLLSASQALLQVRTSETSRTWGSLRKINRCLVNKALAQSIQQYQIESDNL